MRPPIPANDDARVGVVAATGLLDSAPEADFDEVTRLIAELCDVPMASITLIDRDRQWHKSRVGLAAPEAPRDHSFCAHAICDPDSDLFQVADAQLDPRFADNPLVTGDPRIRFYAGAPLVTRDGWCLGTLCVLDRQPRQLTAPQLRALRILRRQVVNLIELRRLVARSEQEARAKADFLAAMSHEIRTPLNAVIGMTTLLKSTPLNAEQEDFVQTLRTSSELLLGIINDVLDFSKIEAGKLEIEAAPFALARCVRDATELVAGMARAKGLPVRVELAPDLPEAIRGDITRIRQILLNLLSNAVKFTDSGQITVRVTGRPLDGDRIELTFTVEDTGIGIPADRIHLLFQDFSQTESSTARRYGGTGLGLAISRRLAELQGGRMWVESESGRGSRFIFSIVTERAAASPAAPRTQDFDETFAARHPARILVAEDNLVNQKVLGRMLQKLGYRPEIVGSGRDALEAARRSPFDIVLMDVEMPDMDGLEASRALRAVDLPGGQPLIVAVTAHALPGNRESYLAAGMDDHLTKPVRLAELTALFSRAQRVPA